MHGAAVLNIILAERRQLDALVDELETLLKEWADSVDSRADSRDWEEFWLVASEGNDRITGPTRAFVESWFARALGLGADVAGDAGSVG